jgi:hypothetical protein
MKIEFTHDFRGKLTGERFYLKGEQVDVDEDTGRELIALNHAVEVKPPTGTITSSKPKPQPEPEVIEEIDIDPEPEEEAPPVRRSRGKK